MMAGGGGRPGGGQGGPGGGMMGGNRPGGNMPAVNPVAMQNMMQAQNARMAQVAGAAHANYIAGLNAQAASLAANKASAQRIASIRDPLSGR